MELQDFCFIKSYESERLDFFIVFFFAKNDLFFPFRRVVCSSYGGIRHFHKISPNTVFLYNLTSTPGLERVKADFFLTQCRMYRR